MEYKYLGTRGFLNEAAATQAHLAAEVGPTLDVHALLKHPIPKTLLSLVPRSIAQEHLVVPLRFDGDTITLTAQILRTSPLPTSSGSS